MLNAKRVRNRILPLVLAIVMCFVFGAAAMPVFAAEYVNGIQTGVTTMPVPSGEITYRGIVGPSIALKTVYASISAHNDTAADVLGTMILQILDGGSVRHEEREDVTFKRWSAMYDSQVDERFVITAPYEPGDSMILTFEVDGTVVARYTHGATTPTNSTDQIFGLEKMDTRMPDYVPAAPWAFDWIVSPTDACWNYPQNYGDALVARWDGDRTAALSITIDDNLTGDHATWRRLSKYYDIPVSWILLNHGHQNGNEALEYESWRMNQDMGLGLESHTYSHWDDVKTSDPTPEREQMVIDEYVKSIDAISRVSGGVVPLIVGFPGGMPHGPYNDLIHRDRHVQYDYFIAQRDATSPTGGAVFSAGDGGLSEMPARIKTLIDTSVLIFGGHSYGTYACHYYHGVGTGLDGAAAATEMRLLHENRDKIWTGLVADVIKYAGERTSATLTTKSALPGAITLGLTDLLHDDTYDYPLTLKVKIDEGWEGVKVTQNGEVSYGTVKLVDGKKQALVRGVPDRGDIFITPCTAQEAIDGTPEPAAMSVATLYNMTYTTNGSQPVHIPGLYSGQEGGEFTITLPKGTKSVSLMPRATYAYSDITYNPSQTVDLSNGSKDVTVTVTSENGKASNEFVLHFVIEEDAPPLVKTIWWQANFEEAVTFSASSGDPNRFNGSYGSTHANGSPLYPDPANREGNKVYGLNCTSGDSFLSKTYFYPTDGAGVEMKLFLPSRSTGTADPFAAFCDTNMLYLRWDSAASNYKWYVGGTHTTGTYGGTVEKDSWIKFSAHIEAEDDEEKTVKERWTNAKLTVWVTQTDAATGEAVTTRVEKAGMNFPLSVRDGKDQGAVVIKINRGVASVVNELLVDDLLIYEPLKIEPITEEPGLTISEISMSKSAAGKYNIGADAKNTLDAAEDVKFIVAVYTGNKLVDVQIISKNIAAGQDGALSVGKYTPAITLQDSNTVRVMAWDAAQSPLCAAYEALVSAIPAE